MNEKIIKLCSDCVRARGGSSSIGAELAMGIVIGPCADCGSQCCPCGMTISFCPAFATGGKRESLRAFRVRETLRICPDDVPTLRELPECEDAS